MASALAPAIGAYRVVDKNGARRHSENNVRPLGSGWRATAASKSSGKKSASSDACPLSGPSALKWSGGCAAGAIVENASSAAANPHSTGLVKLSIFIGYPL